MCSLTTDQLATISTDADADPIGTILASKPKTLRATPRLDTLGNIRSKIRGPRFNGTTAPSDTRRTLEAALQKMPQTVEFGSATLTLPGVSGEVYREISTHPGLPCLSQRIQLRQEGRCVAHVHRILTSGIQSHISATTIYEVINLANTIQDLGAPVHLWESAPDHGIGATWIDPHGDQISALIPAHVLLGCDPKHLGIDAIPTLESVEISRLKGNLFTEVVGHFRFGSYSFSAPLATLEHVDVQNGDLLMPARLSEAGNRLSRQDLEKVRQALRQVGNLRNTTDDLHWQARISDLKELIEEVRPLDSLNQLMIRALRGMHTESRMSNLDASPKLYHQTAITTEELDISMELQATFRRLQHEWRSLVSSKIGALTQAARVPREVEPALFSLPETRLAAELLRRFYLSFLRTPLKIRQ